LKAKAAFRAECFAGKGAEARFAGAWAAFKVAYDGWPIFATINVSLTIEQYKHGVSTLAFICLITPIVAGWALTLLAWIGEISERFRPPHG
jgi:hypothetical protein